MSDHLEGAHTSAAWDRVWSRHSYRLEPIRSERARIKIAAAVAIGMEVAPSDRVLDIACGFGHTLIEGAARWPGHARLFGLDISATALHQARENFQRAHLDTQLTRAEWPRLPFRTASIDKVIAFMAPFPAVIQEVKRVLVPNGKLFVIAPSRDSVISAWYRIHESLRPSHFDELRNYTARDLVAFLSASMTVEEWRVLQSGADRPFSGKIDRAIARLFPDWGRYVVVKCAKPATG
jgi:ubiquinone/menaquinone biosynthesis C-methylase UbiE